MLERCLFWTALLFAIAEGTRLVLTLWLKFHNRLMPGETFHVAVVRQTTADGVRLLLAFPRLELTVLAISGVSDSLLFDFVASHSGMLLNFNSKPNFTE